MQKRRNDFVGKTTKGSFIAFKYDDSGEFNLIYLKFYLIHIMGNIVNLVLTDKKLHRQLYRLNRNIQDKAIEAV